MRYGVGDIHGCFDKFKYLLEREIKVTKNHKIYCVGDVVTKGDKNLETIEYIIWLKKNGYQVHSVMGNHEYRILTLYYSDFEMLEKYLEKYNCKDLLLGEVNEIISLLKQFPFFIETEEWIIAHSFFDNEMSSQSDVRNMLGKSNFNSISKKSLLSKRQLFGHRVIDVSVLEKSVLEDSRKINIDTGCVYKEYGVLSSINLDTMDLISI